MIAFVDITGQRFGRLVALEPGERDANKRTRWWVRCDCGVEKLVDSAHMRYGRINSCGCLQHELAPEHGRKQLARFAGHNRSHGMTGRAIHGVWKGMLDRCRNPNNPSWRYYGALGVTVCERWQVFENFYADMGDAPPGLSIDRINPFGNYEPSNSRWATRREQSLNQRRNSTYNDANKSS